MSGYLFDTSVLSVLAPGRPDATSQFLDWVGQRGPDLFVSVVSIAEVEQGVAKLKRSGSQRRVADLESWMDRTLSRFAGNLLPVDEHVARTAGRLADAALAQGRHPGLADVYLAATARVHGLTLLTRNLRHFAPLGVEARDPLLTPPD